MRFTKSSLSWFLPAVVAFALVMPNMNFSQLQQSSAAQADELSGRLVGIMTLDGYGLQDCLSTHASCGDAIANAWCAAKGGRHSLSYGKADEITGSLSDDLQKVSQTQDLENSFVVVCQN